MALQAGRFFLQRKSRCCRYGYFLSTSHTLVLDSEGMSLGKFCVISDMRRSGSDPPAMRWEACRPRSGQREWAGQRNGRGREMGGAEQWEEQRNGRSRAIGGAE